MRSDFHYLLFMMDTINGHYGMATKHCNSLFSNLINWLAWFWSPATLVLICFDGMHFMMRWPWWWRQSARMKLYNIHRRVSSCICGEVTWRHGCWCFGARGKLGSMMIRLLRMSYILHTVDGRNPAPANRYVVYPIIYDGFLYIPAG